MWPGIFQTDQHKTLEDVEDSGFDGDEGSDDEKGGTLSKSPVGGGGGGGGGGGLHANTGVISIRRNCTKVEICTRKETNSKLLDAPRLQRGTQGDVPPPPPPPPPPPSCSLWMKMQSQIVPSCLSTYLWSA